MVQPSILLAIIAVSVTVAGQTIHVVTTQLIAVLAASRNSATALIFQMMGLVVMTYLV